MPEHELTVRKAAEADLEAAFDWYEQERIGLGDAFLEEVAGRAVGFGSLFEIREDVNFGDRVYDLLGDRRICVRKLDVDETRLFVITARLFHWIDFQTRKDRVDVRRESLCFV